MVTGVMFMVVLLLLEALLRRRQSFLVDTPARTARCPRRLPRLCSFSCLEGGDRRGIFTNTST
jgi:hypothetical protein